ncbi:hypothetical protein BHM03_00013214 [Ensete ventricosum]|nr:hypothetical protein BHM03_00013214 [Ensete ventricosum]
MHRSRGRNPTDCIIERRAVTIRPRLQERSCRGKARITCDMLICDMYSRHSRNTPSYHSLHPTPSPTVELTTPGGSLVLTGITPPPESQPMATQPPEEHPRLLAEPNHTPLGDASTKGLVWHVGRLNGPSFPDDFVRDCPRVVSRLLPGSIFSFDKLAKEFEANFLASALPKPTTVSLLGMR